MPKRSQLGGLFYGLLLFIALPVLLGFVGIVVFTGRERVARKELYQRLGEIASQGLPADDATLLAFTDRLTSAACTQAWLEVLTEWNSRAFTESIKGVPLFDPQLESDVPGPGEPWAEETATRDFLAKWSELNHKISLLAREQLHPEAKPVRFLTEFHSVSTLLPNTQSMRSAARLLSLATIEAEAISRRPKTVLTFPIVGVGGSAGDWRLLTSL